MQADHSAEKKEAPLQNRGRRKFLGRVGGATTVMAAASAGYPRRSWPKQPILAETVRGFRVPVPPILTRFPAVRARVRFITIALAGQTS